MFHVRCIRPRSPKEICATAQRLAEEQYEPGECKLLQQNCQLFASYCVHGVEWMSDAKEDPVDRGVLAMAAETITSWIPKWK